MLQINAIPQKGTTAQRNVHYPTFLKLDDNKRIGFSKAYDGSTDAKGTLYPTNFSTQSNIGAPQTQITAEHANSGGFAQDSGSYTNNEIKYKTGERWVDKYRSMKSVDMACVIKEPASGACNTPSTGGMRSNKLLPVSTDKFITVYQQSSPSGLYARIGTVNASTGAITYGTAVQLSTNTTQWNYVDMITINTDKFAIIYRDPSNNINVVVCTVSGTTITLGTAHTTAVTTGTCVRIKQVTTDKFVYCYVLGSTETRMRICTVSGTTITAGTDTSINTSRYGLDLELESATAGLILQNDSSGNLYARTFSISGTTPTFNTEVQITTVGNYSTSGVYEDVMQWVSGSFYYYHNKNYGIALLIEVTATVPAVVHSPTIQTDDAGGTTCYYMSAPVTVGTKEYMYAFTKPSTYGIFFANVLIDTTAKTVTYTAIKAYYHDSYTYFAYQAIQKIGTTYFALGGNNSDNVSALWEAVFTEATLELRLGSAGSPFATITNAKYAWVFKTFLTPVTINSKYFYLSLKNTSGATRAIQTKNFFVEVD